MLGIKLCVPKLSSWRGGEELDLWEEGCGERDLWERGILVTGRRLATEEGAVDERYRDEDGEVGEISRSVLFFLPLITGGCVARV